MNIFRALKLDKNHLNIATRLKLLFISPLVLSLLALICFFITSLYYYQHHKIDRLLEQTKESSERFYLDSIDNNSTALLGMISVLQQDLTLQNNVLTHNRQALITHTKPIFEGIKENFNVTHLYFIEPSGKVFLREHAVTRFGDKIKRITFLKAQQDKTNSTGIEIGPLGTLTLRVVAPWFDKNQNLIGYIELGMEINVLV
ncbi:MAG: cache domain-containing protein [Legionellaceae bacterium]|nr:cache domain-containing protein [Legionellaceae bacterium]